MSAVAGDVQIGLLDVGGQTRGRTTALNIHHHQRYFSHHRPADRLGLQRDAGATRTGHRHSAAVAGTDRHRHRCDLVLALDERSAVLRQLAAKQLHDIGPRRDRVTGTEPDTGRDQAVADRLVAGHHHLIRAINLAAGKFEKIGDVVRLVAVPGLERVHGGLHHALALGRKTLVDQPLEFLEVEVEHSADQAECINVFALVASRAADRLNRQAGDGDPDVPIFIKPLFVRLNVVAVVNQNTALAQVADVVLVGMLVERQQHIGLIAGTEDIPRAKANLKDGWTAGDGRGDGHHRHDLLLTAAGQTGKEAADGLDTVLGITGNADDCL